MPNLTGTSSSPEVPAVTGTHSTLHGVGISATSEQGIAVRAISKKDTGVFSTSDTGFGLDARSNTNIGVRAVSGQGIALRAEATKDTGVFSTSNTGFGLDARSNTNIGVRAVSEQGIALRAEAKKDTGVFSTSDTGFGLDARSNTNIGVRAVSEKGIAMRAEATKDTAVFATSVTGNAVDARSEKAIGVYAKGQQYAGFFDGVLMVTGDIQLQNADCAEEFDVLAAEHVAPGAVLVIDSEGTLRQCSEAYDRCVAGVVSGAGDFKPGLVLNKHGNRPDSRPVALMGRVFCQVDASFGAIQVGDLLTTSSTPGHAMRATDSTRAFGAVIGKALRPLESGCGLIPILVALQ
ncbi:hypothetical protein JY651_07040 [Pyxidicoccus parkwayensis]|uniref:Uncharacterized protein n=1 Tax=Pyxidicoccus parkwayensis TaxID=2813578 RepID=A0ABX7P2A8_9BACT|nr:hypothetical protein [Pyxidicoccus parkwaysis]QSQ24697.1 hypothetical protein JY651_07040 [Pyxidicoccus parkwaysis]